MGDRLYRDIFPTPEGGSVHEAIPYEPAIITAYRCEDVDVEREEHAFLRRVVIEADQPCLICFQDYGSQRVPTILRFGHYFCSSCIQGWITVCDGKRRRANCPVCRATIDSVYL